MGRRGYEWVTKHCPNFVHMKFYIASSSTVLIADRWRTESVGAAWMQEISAGARGSQLEQVVPKIAVEGRMDVSTKNLGLVHKKECRWLETKGDLFERKWKK